MSEKKRKAKRSAKPERERLTKEEMRKRAEEFPLRRQKFVASIKGKDPLAEALDEIYGKRESNEGGEAANGRSKRMKLTAEESLQYMKDFSSRKEKIIAALRKSKDRSVHS
jgi:hypothetical protein